MRLNFIFDKNVFFGSRINLGLSTALDGFIEVMREGDRSRSTEGLQPCSVKNWGRRYASDSNPHGSWLLDDWLCRYLGGFIQITIQPHFILNRISLKNVNTA